MKKRIDEKEARLEARRKMRRLKEHARHAAYIAAKHGVQETQEERNR